MRWHVRQCCLKEIAGGTFGRHGIQEAKDPANGVYPVHKDVPGHWRIHVERRLFTVQKEVNGSTITICKLRVHRYLCRLRLSGARLMQWANMPLSIVRVFYRH